MSKTRGPLISPKQRIRRSDLISFIETAQFTHLWSKLKLTEDDLLLVQIAIMCDPQGPPVMQGTGRVRKIRFSPISRPTGKRDAQINSDKTSAAAGISGKSSSPQPVLSGPLRLCYIFFEKHQTAFLALVYPKSQKENLSESDKQRIRKAIADIESELNEIAGDFA